MRPSVGPKTEDRALAIAGASATSTIRTIAAGLTLRMSLL
jgi:hypothetical protein